jgi:hypothetical protein
MAHARTWRQLFLALGLLLCYGAFIQLPAWNEYSRYDLIRALVEERTVSIDSFHENTGDKAFKDGHYYSDKAPGTAIAGVPVFAAYLAVNRLAGIDEPDQQDAVAALALAVNGVSTVLLVLLLVRFLIPVVGEPWSLLVGAAYGLGTIAFPFATMFFGHALSTAALFAAFFLLHRSRRTHGRWEPIAAGLFAGYAVITEIPVVLGVAVLAAYALWLGRGVALRFVLGGIPVALVLLGYDWVTFGSPLSLGYQYSTGFAEQNAQGIVSIVWPSAAVLLDLLFNPRGLLVLAPWLALAPLGLLAARSRRLRPEVLVSAAVCVVFLTYNSGALNPFGGWTPGPRYLMPMLPFAALLVALAPRRIRPLTVVLMAVSVIAMVAATVTRPNAQELYENPLVQLWLPRLLGGHLAETVAWERWGFSGLQPLGLLLVGAVAVIAGVRATRTRGRASDVAAIGSAAMLLVLIVTCALPAPAPSAASVASVAGAQDAGSPAIRVASTGAYRLTVGDDDQMLMWVQLENAGRAVDDTRIEFRVANEGGDGGQWAAWYGGIGWRPGERRTSTLGWTIDGDPAAHGYEIRVLDQSGGVLASTGPFRPFGGS